MRVVAAALFVYSGVLLAVTLFSGVMSHVSPILFGLGMAVLFLLLVAAVTVVFNPWWATVIRFKGEAEGIEWLEEKGLLVSTDFSAVRAFQVEEFDDEGPHYFLELVGGGVLYLNGQYLLDYQLLEDEDDDASNQPQRFPCTEFTVRRHRDKGFVVEILCRGDLLVPENVVPAFERAEYRRGRVPEDGDVIVNESFDELKERIGQAH